MSAWIRSLKMREWVRFALFASLLVAIAEYIRFASYVATGQGAAAFRPGVADAFLPLGGLAGIKVWLGTGFWDTLHPIALVVTLAILITAWLFRRAPCSWLCPIGGVSEYLGRFGKKLTGGRTIKVPKWLDRTLIGIKYAVTVLILAMILAAPAVDVKAFMMQPFYAVSDYQLYHVYATNIVIASLIILVILALSTFVKSAWCRYLCPYGALQGLFGIVSPVVLSKNPETCTSCGKCNRACMNVVDVAGARKTVVSAECMGCGACVEACPQEDTLSFKLLGRFRIDPKLMGVLFLVVFAFIVLLAIVTGHWNSTLTTQQYRTLSQQSTGAFGQ